MLNFRAAVFFLCSAAIAQSSTPPENILITLQRTGCAMDLSCPAYGIEIRGDGTIAYEGRSSVHALGSRTRRTAVGGS